MIWVRRGAIAVLMLVLLAAAILYGGSELMLRRHVPGDLPRIQAATDPAEVAEGARLARIENCVDCHGDRGQVIFDDPAIARITAPALARIAEQASDAQLARAIRNGIGVDARPLYVMPTQALNRLADQDVARIIGWIRTLQTSAFDRTERRQVGAVGRLGLLTGRFQSSVNLQSGQPVFRPAETGAYLVQVACLQCHLLDRDKPESVGDSIAPALAPTVASYDPAALRTLLRTGRGAGGRQLSLMSRASRNGLFALNDAEIDAIQQWLRAQTRR